MTTKPIFDREYSQGPTAGWVDWVAGGNFDGYVEQKSIIFKESKEVIIKTVILDQSRYDGNVDDSELAGIFEYTDKDTITINCDQIVMLGKILGENQEFLVFSVSHTQSESGWNETYKLK